MQLPRFPDPRRPKGLQTHQGDLGPVAARAGAEGEGGHGLIALTDQDRRALAWLRTRAGQWTTGCKFIRKRMPPGPFSQRERRVLLALVQLREGAVTLIQMCESIPTDDTEG